MPDRPIEKRNTNRKKKDRIFMKISSGLSKKKDYQNNSFFRDLL